MFKESKAFEFGPFRLEVHERRLTRDGRSVPLRGKVFDTLLALVTHHGSLMTKDEVMVAVWGDTIVDENNLNHNICVLRHALGGKATGRKYIKTVPRQKYRFIAQVGEVFGLGSSEVPYSWEMRKGLSSKVDAGREASKFSLILPSQAAIPNGVEVSRQVPRNLWCRHPVFIGLLAAPALLLSGYFGAKRHGIILSGANPRTMLAVLPFENLTGDAGQEYIADGLGHEIICQLGRWNASNRLLKNS